MLLYISEKSTSPQTNKKQERECWHIGKCYKCSDLNPQSVFLLRVGYLYPPDEKKPQTTHCFLKTTAWLSEYLWETMSLETQDPFDADFCRSWVVRGTGKSHPRMVLLARRPWRLAQGQTQGGPWVSGHRQPYWYHMQVSGGVLAFIFLPGEIIFQICKGQEQVED